MSALMGSKTSSAAHGHSGSSHESVGMIIRTVCPACGEAKKAGSSHPKCSRILQGMYSRGEL